MSNTELTNDQLTILRGYFDKLNALQIDAEDFYDFVTEDDEYAGEVTGSGLSYINELPTTDNETVNEFINDLCGNYFANIDSLLDAVNELEYACCAVHDYLLRVGVDCPTPQALLG